jgi:Protein of unknown function (DUF3224)
MATNGKGSFTVTSWNEDRYVDIEGDRGLSQADVTQDFTGTIEGEGAVRWLMSYRPDGTADWVGYQRIVGRLGDRTGSFVLQSTGTFDGTTAAGDWAVVPDSGTGELAGLRGTGRMEAPMGTEATYTFEYEL